MYFAVIGKNTEISHKELELVKPQNIKYVNEHIILFDLDNELYLNQLGGIIKRGKLINKDQLPEFLEGKKILGTKDKVMGMNLKKEFKIKRFKTVALFKTDLDVKKKGIEILNIQGQYGVVLGYQNIPLYEDIDFNKPVRDMDMGMMPSKLTHIMTNIALSECEKDADITVYDPFVGSGTTGFVANWLLCNFIGSDIDISKVNPNLEWRKKTDRWNDQQFDIFENDVTKEFDNEKLKNVDVIVSEGWLGPIVKRNTHYKKIEEFQSEVLYMYEDFLENVDKFWGEDKPVIVMTIPIYLGHDNFLEENIRQYTSELGMKFEAVDEVYKREKQNVGRKIIILK